MENSGDKFKLVRQLLADLRKKLLDISPRNPLINTHFSERSRTHIRVMNTLPNDLYKQMKDGKTLTFASIPKNKQIISDDLTDPLSVSTQSPISSDAHSRFGSNPLRLDDLFSNGETQYLDKEQKHKTKPNSNSFHKSQKE